MLEQSQKTCSTDNVTKSGTRGQSAGNTNDLAWVCGFIDGEGCLYLRKRQPKDRVIFVPEIVISNTHLPSLERISDVLISFGITGGFISHGNATNARKHPNWKETHRLTIHGAKRVKQFLSLALPYIFTKQQQAKTLLQFVELRLTKSTRDIHGVEEFRFVEMMHELNRRGSSETARAPLSNDSDDTVQA